MLQSVRVTGADRERGTCGDSAEQHTLTIIGYWALKKIWVKKDKMERRT